MRPPKARGESCARALALLLVLALTACTTNPLPPSEIAPPKGARRAEMPPHEVAPSLEYEIGDVRPDVARVRFDALKPKWDTCFHRARRANETLRGKLTFTVRTNRDGSVRWAYVKESDLGDVDVERCVVDAVKTQNFGAPMDAKEGEIKGHTYGWEIDEDDSRPADPASPSTVVPTLQKNTARLAECRARFKAKGAMKATLYVAPGGEPTSVGVAMDDPSADAAVTCVAAVLKSLTYVNKSSWTTKVTAPIP